MKSRERSFQVERIACAKVLRQARARHVQGISRRPVWLEWSR